MAKSLSVCVSSAGSMKDAVFKQVPRSAVPEESYHLVYILVQSCSMYHGIESVLAGFARLSQGYLQVCSGRGRGRGRRLEPDLGSPACSGWQEWLS